MPVISRFYGIVIRMYFASAEHNPPHIHAIYGNYVASLDIQLCKVIDGYLPKRAECMVIEWMTVHKDELIFMWNTQEFKKIEPLS